MVVTGFDFTERFKREFRTAPVDVQKAATSALEALLKNPGSVRAHALKGHKPKLFSMDVFSNHSWQVTFELKGTVAILIRIAPHTAIDRSPR